MRFRSTTAAALLRLPAPERRARLSGLCLVNCRSLLAAVETVRRLGIGAFRISSQLFPRITHPGVGCALEELDDYAEICAVLTRVRMLAASGDIRLSFHPDQFVVLSSPRPEVVAASLREIEAQAQLAELAGAGVINLHAGGAYDDKTAALARFSRAFARLSAAAQQRLTVENDDVSYTPADLLPLCHELAIPLVYDVHHHRCLPDRLSIGAATEACLQSWESRREEGYVHISSPRNGWSGAPRPHADFIDPADFPCEWFGQKLTVDVEAKAKEAAILRLMSDLARWGRSGCGGCAAAPASRAGGKRRPGGGQSA